MRRLLNHRVIEIHNNKIQTLFKYLILLDTMWSIVQVCETGTLALTQQLSELRTNNEAEQSLARQKLGVSIWHQYNLFHVCVYKTNISNIFVF